jgi:hypothetical protein
VPPSPETCDGSILRTLNHSLLTVMIIPQFPNLTCVAGGSYNRAYHDSMPPEDEVAASLGLG